ncbi:DUF6636 domain-containing protein [Moraxella nasicaprae]|uniref:Uncharacterized protein n=1 Tax=Moraxella nasicaprae TaxID=2904122 RepID=A0ABY6F3N1_9GAMM|nr:DUF6636 domain-containing protein [Moraxella nasicaprae]UXZ04692.1 hypothetical protein LU297_09015 [Moraxella nasicaprae]
MKTLTKFLAVAGFLPLSALAVEFQSPSGNILCSGDEYELGYVSCFIMETDNARPPIPRPSSCDADWGQDFGLNRTGRAHMNCYSDFPYNQGARVLAYGQSVSGKGWTCTSQQSGMRCTNKDGRGFLLSRKKQTLF